MRRALAVCLAASITASLIAASANAGTWRVERVNTPARVTAIETIAGKPYAFAGGLWYEIAYAAKGAKLTYVDMPPPPKPPDGALPDGVIVSGSKDISRAWLSEPTTRYDHGVLGDAIEAGSLSIEKDGKTHTLRLKRDAVFEDRQPRLADLDGDGHDEMVVVKSYLKRGAALAVVALRKGRYEIVAETPPLGGPNRWLNPAGIADFTGSGKLSVALVRQPHVVGELQLWSFIDGDLRKLAALPGFANHIIGSRAIAMSAVADFNGDDIADLALPSLDRGRLRIVTFAPEAREIANVTLPKQAVTNLARVPMVTGAPPVAVGLSDGSLVLVRND